MKKYRIGYLIIIMSVLLCGLWGGGRLALVWLTVLLALPVCSGAGLYLSAKGFSLAIWGERSCYCTQKLGLKLKLFSSRFAPAGNIRVDLMCENHVFGTKEEIVCLIRPGVGKRQEYAFSINTDMCGGRSIQVREMVCYDLLGLFSCRKIVEAEHSCIVYPYEAQIYVSLGRYMEREQQGDIYDGKKSGTDVSEVFGLREYREGDALQSIHWKLSGKMKQLIVREFGRPVNYHTLVLLAPALFYGEKEAPGQMVNAVFDLGVSFSHALLNQNIAHFVGFLSGDGVCCLPVDSLHSYENMRLKLMSHPVPSNGDRTIFSFMNQQLYRSYTKVVYVTGEVNESAAGNLSVLADLIVLQAAEGASGYLTDDNGYKLVKVSIENMRNVEHIIPL